MVNLPKLIKELNGINDQHHHDPDIVRCVAQLDILREQLIKLHEDVGDIHVDKIAMAYFAERVDLVDSIDDRFEDILYEEKSK
tara:strand:+ start:183 stop:431 length:249 start_codon:yes stop_codon:yes gene_type:complete